MIITNCANCNKEINKWPYELIRSPRLFCNRKCKGEWASNNCTGENGYNWRGGTWNNRVQVLAHTSYRTWRKKQLDNNCKYCGTKYKLELHHIVPRSKGGAIKDKSNILTICAICHDKLHSNTGLISKLGELLGTPNVKTRAISIQAIEGKGSMEGSTTMKVSPNNNPSQERPTRKGRYSLNLQEIARTEV